MSIQKFLGEYQMLALKYTLLRFYKRQCLYHDLIAFEKRRRVVGADNLGGFGQGKGAEGPNSPMVAAPPPEVTVRSHVGHAGAATRVRSW